MFGESRNKYRKAHAHPAKVAVHPAKLIRLGLWGDPSGMRSYVRFQASKTFCSEKLHANGWNSFPARQSRALFAPRSAG